MAISTLPSTTSTRRLRFCATIHRLSNHYLIVRVQGVESNRDGIGAIVTVETSAGTQVREIRAGSSFLAQDDIRAHFGLGKERMVQQLAVHWPSGQVDRFADIQADRILTVREGQGLSP